jgi:ubiquinone/menaquinone biosynthesis C-methylase UbiE
VNWRNYWENLHNLEHNDEQFQVLRTRNGIAINDIKWEKTKNFVLRNLLQNQDRPKSILDACGGNGLFTRDLIKLGHKVTIVDINSDLLSNIKIDNESLILINSDLIKFLLKTSSKFDCILFYAGIQYFTEVEVVIILREFERILEKGGIAYIGDIPDIDQRERFLVENNRYHKYFSLLEKGFTQIGTWFKKDWLKLLTSFLNYEKYEIISQPSYQIYSDFRFDLKIYKSE